MVQCKIRVVVVFEICSQNPTGIEKTSFLKYVQESYSNRKHIPTFLFWNLFTNRTKIENKLYVTIMVIPMVIVIAINVHVKLGVEKIQRYRNVHYEQIWCDTYGWQMDRTNGQDERTWRVISATTCRHHNISSLPEWRHRPASIETQFPDELHNTDEVYTARYTTNCIIHVARTTY